MWYIIIGLALALTYVTCLLALRTFQKNERHARLDAYVTERHVLVGKCADLAELFEHAGSRNVRYLNCDERIVLRQIHEELMEHARLDAPLQCGFDSTVLNELS